MCKFHVIFHRCADSTPYPSGPANPCYSSESRATGTEPTSGGPDPRGLAAALSPEKATAALSSATHHMHSKPDSCPLFVNFRKQPSGCPKPGPGVTLYHGSQRVTEQPCGTRKLSHKVPGTGATMGNKNLPAAFFEDGLNTYNSIVLFGSRKSKSPRRGLLAEGLQPDRKNLPVQPMKSSGSFLITGESRATGSEPTFTRWTRRPGACSSVFAHKELRPL